MNLFITATDTDVGKTFITCALLQALLQKQIKATALKPIQTGCEIINGKTISPDVNEYKKILGNQCIEPKYAFEFPASPHYSSQLENTYISLKELSDYVQHHSKNYEITLIEGAGGVFVPINDTTYMLDLIKAANARVVLVFDNKLGAINQVLQNTNILQNAGIEIAAIVANNTEFDNPICVSNIKYLENKLDDIHIIHLPLFENKDILKAAPYFDEFIQKIVFRQPEKLDLEFDHKHLWHPYTNTDNPQSVEAVIGATDNKIITENGVLIDGISSWWCAVNGYGHNKLVQAACRQISQFSHVMFGGLTHKPAIDLGKKLLEIMPEFNHIFYCDSGSVAVEIALKTAIQYQQNKTYNKNKILTVLGGYHGDTFGAMSVCDPQNGMHFMFHGVLMEQIFAPKPNCPFDQPFDENCLTDIRNIFARNKQKIAAVIIEPIVQAAGGMWFYHQEFLCELRRLCDENDTLLIFDEIATGFGHTGKLFAYQYTDISPDIILIGKALTGGFMGLAAVLSVDKVATTIAQNNGMLMHGPTFMANPLACAVSLESIKLLEQSNWQEQVKRIENILKQQLYTCLKLNNVASVRVLGAIGNVELKVEINRERMQKFFVDKGVWIRPFGKNVYLMPPFNTPDDELIYLCDCIFEAIEFEHY